MYSTVPDVKNALAVTASQNAGAAATPAPQIEDAIREADARVNTYLSVYAHPLPMSDTPNQAVVPVLYWSRNIAAYNVMLTYLGSKNLEERDPVNLRYIETMKELAAVRDGLVNLPFPRVGGGAGDGGDGDSAVFNMYNGRLFGAEDLVYYNGRATTQHVTIWPGV